MSGEASLDELIERLETATGPDQDIDADIWDFIGLTEGEAQHCAGWISQNGRDDLTRRDYLLAWSKRFTASIDAAVKLVPKGAGWRWLIDKRPYADGGRPDGYRAAVWCAPLCPAGECEAWLSTPALALATAAMKARRHD